MKRTLSDLSQLSAAMFKKKEQAPKTIGEENQAPQKNHDAKKLSSADAEVMAYFGLAESAERRPETEGGEHLATDTQREVDERLKYVQEQLVAARKACKEAEEARDAAELRAIRAEAKSADLQTECAKLRKDFQHYQGECNRLSGELARITKKSDVSQGDELAAIPMDANTSPSATTLLALPSDIHEVFPGECRELVLDALRDAATSARQTDRDRRASVFSAILAANPSSGELDCRRTELKQRMKDGGYYTDPTALEDLGFRLVSGKKHWKLEYADVRMPIAKTPSDYRANLNMAAELAKHCL